MSNFCDIFYQAYQNDDIDIFKQLLDKASAEGFYADTYIRLQDGFQDNLIIRLLVEAINFGDISEERLSKFMSFMETALLHRQRQDITILGQDGLWYIINAHFQNINVKCRIIQLMIDQGEDVRTMFASPSYFHGIYESEVINILIKNAGEDFSNRMKDPEFQTHTIESILCYNIPDPFFVEEHNLGTRFNNVLKSLELMLQQTDEFRSDGILLTLSSLKRDCILDFRSIPTETIPDLPDKMNKYLPLFDEFSLKALDLFLEHGADINYTDPYGNNAVTVCTCLALLKRYKELGLDITHANNKSETLLNAVINDRKSTKTIYTMYCPDSIEILDEYLNCNGPINTPSQSTALFTAADLNDTEVLKKLVSAGADTNIRDKDGKTAVFKCFHNDISVSNPDAVNIFAEAGTDFSITDNHGCNVIHYWAKALSYSFLRSDSKDIEQELRTLEVLVNAGADVNALDDSGKTPAAELLEFFHGQSHLTSEIMPYLHGMIDLGADFNIKNPITGESAMDMVPFKKYKKLLNRYAQHRQRLNSAMESDLEEYER